MIRGIITACLAVLASCGVESADPPPVRVPRQAAGTLLARGVEVLPCFRCHDIETWGSSPRFPHRAHKSLGHCTACHEDRGHEGHVVVVRPCVSCHSRYDRAEAASEATP